MTIETSSNRPTHRAYAVIKKEGREKGTWLEIGAARPLLAQNSERPRNAGDFRATAAPSWASPIRTNLVFGSDKW